jgi:predicted aspartyl protease
MGLTILPLEVANQSSPQQTETVEFLIDPGALYSVVPRPVLERLGIAPVGEQKFRLASEQTSDSTLLGAHTLESLGLALDPIRRELMPLPMMLASVPATDEPL